jgi:hypothetical protein
LGFEVECHIRSESGLGIDRWFDSSGCYALQTLLLAIGPSLRVLPK